MQELDQTSKGYIVRLYSLTVSEDHSCPVGSHEHEKGGGREGMDSSELYSVAGGHLSLFNTS